MKLPIINRPLLLLSSGSQVCYRSPRSYWLGTIIVGPSV